MSDDPTTGSGALADDPSGAGDPPAGDGDDEGLLAELRGLATVLDPVPPGALAAARSAIAWRTMDAELAELAADPTGDPATGPRLPAAAGVRGAQAPALLSFEAGDFAVEVEVEVDEEVEVEGDLGARRLVGQVVPPASGEVEVRHGGARVAVAIDPFGRFSASGIASGPVSLRCRVGGRVVETDWFLA